MKKTNFIFAFMLMVGIVTTGVIVTSNTPPAVNRCVDNVYYKSPNNYPIYTGKMDTIKGAHTDTFKLACGCNPVSMVFNNDLYLASIVIPTVTPTVTVALYESSNGGLTYNWNAPLTTYTVSAVTSFTVAATDCTTPVTSQYFVNAGFGGSPYTNYCWVSTGHVSDTVQWMGSVTMK